MSILFQPFTSNWTTGGRPLRVHLLAAGKGTDKTRFREARIHNRLSVVDAILDTRFTDWLPIWVVVIEHPEGVFLVDTGLDSAINDPNYFSNPFVNRYIRTQFQFSIAEPLTSQLAGHNLVPDTILLTHLHFDHIGGLRDFPKTPVLLHEAEWAHPFGALPKLYPPGFNPTLLHLDTSIGPFKKTRFLTADKNLALIHTPGHTPGHCSVLLKTDTAHILFAGDVCYDSSQLENGKFAANLASYKTAAQTYAAIKEYSRQHPLLFLSAHDPDAANLFTQRKPLNG
jgi:glyoxylase-like metal-dependent hydrolase (beta-lactamase superfamily II)